MNQTLTVITLGIALTGAVAGAVQDDAISLNNLGGGAIVLIQGRRGGTCVRDGVLVAKGTLPMGGTMTATTACPSRVAVFAEDRVMALKDKPAWSHDPAKPLKIKLTAPPKTVPLHVMLVIPPGQTGVGPWADFSLEEVNLFLASNRLGLRVDAGPVTVADTSQAQTIGVGCETVETLMKSSNASYHADKVNVYFVPSVHTAGYDDWLGYTCYEPNAKGIRAPNVIFVSYWYGAPTTLTHELGHALGLRWASAHTNPGAQDGRTDFPETNLMYSYVDWDTQAAQSGLSLGQAFRMNADTASWLNAGQKSGAVMKCDPDPTDQKSCPRLSVDVP